MSDIYGIGLHAAACYIDLCLDLAYDRAWAVGAPPESAHTPSERG